MPVPKRKVSKSRRDKRRSHDFAVVKGHSLCSHCGQPKKPHFVCSSCGYYNNKEVVTVSGD